MRLEMPEIIMDGSNWTTPDDVYDAFFKAVGAPAWHGRNFNALRDSIAVGRVNRLEIPYSIKIRNYSSIGAGARETARGFIDLINDLHASGCSVRLEIES